MLNLFLSLLLYFFYSSNTLSVTSFGATGNGVTDDTNAINSALSAAHSQNKNLYFPPGTYLCNITDNSGYILKYEISGTTNLSIYGNNATILTTKDSASVQLYIYSFLKSYGFIISNLAFQNNHGKIIGQTNAIFMTGTNGQNIDTTVLTNCRFTGFSNAVVGQGINGWQIKNDTFYSPAGHDNAQQNTQPGVYLWFADNVNGYCTNLDIQYNIANGYTGPLPLNCPRPIDGFIYGTGYGYHIAYNTLSNFSQEGIEIAPPTTFPNTTASILIENNNIDCSLPVGSIDSGGVAHKYNYAIRVDASNATIRYNTINNYTWGIMERGVDYPTISPQNYNITDNVFYTPLDTSTNIVQKAVYINGSNGNHVAGVNIQRNIIHRADTSYIQTINTQTPLIYGNLNFPN